MHGKFKITPVEKLTKRKPDIRELLPFGCIGVTAIQNSERQKGGLGDRGRYVRVMGYTNRYQTYVVMTRTGKVYKRRLTKVYPDVFESRCCKIR